MLIQDLSADTTEFKSVGSVAAENVMAIMIHDDYRNLRLIV